MGADLDIKTIMILTSRSYSFKKGIRDIPVLNNLLELVFLCTAEADHW